MEDRPNNVFVENAQAARGPLRLSDDFWPESRAHRSKPQRPPPSWKAQGPNRPNRMDAARNAVAAENHASVGLSPEDIRFELAHRAAQSLEGGRAALLRPEKRDELVKHATSNGMRAFDAHLVIAIVQDAGRRGDVIASLKPRSKVSNDSQRLGSTLQLIPTPGNSKDDSPLLWSAALGIVLGLFALACAIVLMS